MGGAQSDVQLNSRKGAVVDHLSFHHDAGGGASLYYYYTNYYYLYLLTGDSIAGPDLARDGAHVAAAPAPSCGAINIQAKPVVGRQDGTHSILLLYRAAAGQPCSVRCHIASYPHINGKHIH